MKEEEIRPKLIFEEYLRLAALDAETYFSDSFREAIRCPACLSEGNFSFRKHGFDYEECPNCQTLFVSPRPPASSFFRYYQESPSASFFATTFYKITSAPRREKLWQPKAALIHETLKKHGGHDHEIVDIGGGYGIFAEEYQRLAGRSVTVVEPGPELAQICRLKGLSVIERFLEQVERKDLPDGPKAFVSFELFEHLHDPSFFLKQLSHLMNPGDLFMFTTLSGLGVDIQALWSESKSFSLQHLNFFNPRSIHKLIQHAELQMLSVDTPGKLDMDILVNNVHLIQERSWRNIIRNSDASSLQRWQNFIVENRLSSHMFVVCTYPNRKVN